MKQVKVLLFVAAICSALTAVLCLWFDESLQCSEFRVKVLETVMIISSLILTKEYYSIK